MTSTTVKTCVLLALAVVFALAISVRAGNDDRFSQFESRYGKHYRNNNERTYRQSVFAENARIVEQLNNEDPTAEYTLTEFSDLTTEEFSQRFLMRPADSDEPPQEPMPVSSHSARALKVVNSGAIPAAFDWRSRGAITPVKNQGGCGSCWAFSALEQIESLSFLSGKPLNRLSAQQIVDCDTSNYACAGGWPGNAYNYIMKAGGLALESTYPYTSGSTVKAGACKFTKSMIKAPLASWSFVSKTGAVDETKMVESLYRYGPLSVCLDATNWQYYRGGIFSSSCGTAFTHCVQIVGYGVASNVPYWTIKNQWGTGWGESGYMRLQRGINKCIIGQYATQVVV